MGIETKLGDSFLTTKLSWLVGKGRQFSLWPYTFATKCCGIEFMSAMAPHYDLSRFGAERISFPPRQSDVLIVMGQISIKMAPVLKKIYDQMAEPKWVISMGACASTGGIFDAYPTVMGISELLPVDVYIAGCPPRPESFIEGFMKLQKKVREASLLETNSDSNEM